MVCLMIKKLLPVFVFFLSVGMVSAQDINFCNPGDYRCGKAGGDWSIPCSDDNGDGYYEWSVYNHVFCYEGCDQVAGLCYGDIETTCQDFCNPGDQRCGLTGDYVVYCNDDNGDGCYEWSVYDVDYCSDGCVNGYCTSEYDDQNTGDECRDKCVKGERRCSGPKDYIVCKTDSSTGCTFWKENDDYFCEYGCDDGECRSEPQKYCTDYCTQGDKRCAGDGNFYIECGDYDSNSCYEWGGDWTTCEYGCTEGDGEARCKEGTEYDMTFYDYNGNSASVLDDNYSTYQELLTVTYPSLYSCFPYQVGQIRFSVQAYQDDQDPDELSENIDFELYDFDTSSWELVDREYPCFDRNRNYTVSIGLSDRHFNGSYCVVGRIRGGTDDNNDEYCGCPECSDPNPEVRELVSSYYYGLNISCDDLCVPGTKRCGGVSGEAEYSFPCTLQPNGCYGWDYDEGVYCNNFCNRQTGLCYQSGELPDINFCSSGDFRCGKEGGKYSIPCDDDDSNGFYEWSLYNNTYCYYGCVAGTGLCREIEDFCTYGECRCGGDRESPDRLICCGDTNNDGYYEWNPDNVTVCRWGCTEDLDVPTDMHYASCNSIGSEVVDGRNLVEYAAANVDTAVPGSIRFLAAILLMGLAFGLGYTLTQSTQIASVSMLSVLGICSYYLWIPLPITVIIFGLSSYFIYRQFMGDSV